VINILKYSGKNLKEDLVQSANHIKLAGSSSERQKFIIP